MRRELRVTAMVGIALLCQTSAAMAGQGARGSDAPISFSAPDSGGNIEPDPKQYCSAMMDYYRDMAKDPQSELTQELRDLIARLSEDSGDCPTRLAEVEGAIGAYWLTDPWCKREKADFKLWLDTNDSAKSLPSYSHTVIADLLSMSDGACRDGLTTAQGIARFYAPDAFPMPYPTAYSGVASALPDSPTVENARAEVSKQLKAKRLRSHGKGRGKGRCSRR